MRREVERVKVALDLARKHVVALISGGDPSIYGILPLVIEYAAEKKVDVDIEAVPGVTAASAASALLGSPISGDFAVVSLSDLLVPWSVVERRLVYALNGDFVVAIYNPSSRRRKKNFKRAVGIIRKFRGMYGLGFVRNAGREGQQVEVRRVRSLMMSI